MKMNLKFSFASLLWLSFFMMIKQEKNSIHDVVESDVKPNYCAYGTLQGKLDIRECIK